MIECGGVERRHFAQANYLSAFVQWSGEKMSVHPSVGLKRSSTHNPEQVLHGAAPVRSSARPGHWIHLIVPEWRLDGAARVLAIRRARRFSLAGARSS